MKQTGGRPGGSCTAALFLKAFVDGIEAKDGCEAPLRWAHIDIAGSMEFTRPSPYCEKGMSGRPVRWVFLRNTAGWRWARKLIGCDCDVHRALIEFVRRLSQAK